MARTGERKDKADLIRWVSCEIIPHEADVRAWLRRSLVVSGEVDDVVQEAYCRLSDLKDHRHILNPRAYFFQTARSIVLEQMRRARIVRIEAVTEIDALRIEWDEPSPERIAGGRKELARVMEIVAALPERARRIFEMRKILGLSQREIAQTLGVSENIVENEAARGLKTVLAALEAHAVKPDDAQSRRRRA